MTPPRSWEQHFSDEELRGALAAAAVGIWSWDIASDHLRWSPETAALFGLPAEGFEGTFADFATRIHPDDRDAVRVMVERAIETRSQDYRVEYRVMLGGDVRWLDSRGRVVVDEAGAPKGMVGTALDITATKEDAARLRESEARYRLFTELASDYVYEVDMRAPTLAPNIVAGAFERTTGYTPAEVAEAGGWLGLMHPDDRGNVAELFEALRAGRPFLNEYRIRSKTTGVRWLRDHAQPILDPSTGELLRIVGGVQDITERKELEARLSHASKLEALAQLAGGVAHDFNNLLTVMMVTSSALVREGDEQTVAAAAELDSSIQRATELTRSLLTFARRQPAEMRVTPLALGVDAALPMLNRAVGERVRIAVVDNSGEALVALGKTQLDMVLLNLGVNARDAMPEGGELRITIDVVELAARDHRRPPELAEGRYAQLAIADSGVGMTADVLQHLFEPFFTTKGPDKGTGLGLATVHGIVTQLRGAIVATSTLGSGSCFTIYLPLASGAIGSVEAGQSSHAIGGTERVVLVEDEPAVSRLLVSVLTDLGYTVVAFPSAEAARAEGAALDSCDLLLTDVRLPGISGTELALRLVETRPKLRVLLMSGFVEDEQQAAIVEKGLFSFLAKPFVPAGLARRIREVLDAR